MFEYYIFRNSRFKMIRRSFQINNSKAFRVVEYILGLNSIWKIKKGKGIGGHYSFHARIEWLGNCFFDNCSQLNC